ncbi:hypothetical protein ACFQ21_00060 [Ohtaekwangia kribbensis]|uniref:Baseplate protein J-like domain-containing protein n=1 Tax=Ohtaekwangia kribbensis TaxID=688913 RepID=A0ABW3JVI9_9BACT
MRTIAEILEQINIAKQRINEIYLSITGEVNSDATLAGLTSASKTAEFKLWIYIWACMSYIQEQVWEEKRLEIEEEVNNSVAGTDQWLQQELLKFQYGDALLINTTTKKPYYAVIDATKQIVKRCAVVSSGGVTQIKVAKENGSGDPIALSAPELSAFASYMKKIQFAGSNLGAPVSLASDKLNAPMTVYYNGTVVLDDMKALVQAAFNNYLKNLPFNAEYKISAHQDYIQAVANVNDVVIGVVQAKANAGSYGTVNRVYYPAAGYLERDATIDFDTMITYVPQ